MSPGAEVPYEDCRGVFVRRTVARVGRNRLVVGPCIACSLRSGVALALEILFFAPLSIVTKQETTRCNSTSAETAGIGAPG